MEQAEDYLNLTELEDSEEEETNTFLDQEGFVFEAFEMDLCFAPFH